MIFIIISGEDPSIGLKYSSLIKVNGLNLKLKNRCNRFNKPVYTSKRKMPFNFSSTVYTVFLSTINRAIIVIVNGMIFIMIFIINLMAYRKN